MVVKLKNQCKHKVALIRYSYNRHSDYLILYRLNIAAIEPNNHDGLNEFVRKRRA